MLIAKIDTLPHVSLSFLVKALLLNYFVKNEGGIGMTEAEHSSYAQMQPRSAKKADVSKNRKETKAVALEEGPQTASGDADRQKQEAKPAASIKSGAGTLPAFMDMSDFEGFGKNLSGGDL